jgi:hypothetical protein
VPQLLRLLNKFYGKRKGILQERSPHRYAKHFKNVQMINVKDKNEE